MRLVSCSKLPHKPCIVLKLEEFGLCIVLDMGLDLSSVFHFLPSTLISSTRLSSLPGWRSKDSNPPSSKNVSRIFPEFKQCSGRLLINGNPEVLFPDFSNISIDQIDAVLISNYTSMLALPHLTSHPDFRGTVFATDPTVQLGKLLMEELVEYFERMTTEPEKCWKTKENVKNLKEEISVDCRHWRTMFTKEHLENCLLKINLIAFKETLDIHGVLKVAAYSSGYCIGSVNWLMQTDYERIVYLSASSAVTAHAKALDLSPLRDPDVLIVTSLSEAPIHHPDQMVGAIAEAVVQTLKAGGNVLIPCNPMGVLYDLLEFIGNYLEKSVGVPMDVPIYFVSPVSDSALAYATIFAEWLSESKQANVYLPEEPFPHSQYLKSGRLKAYSAIYKNMAKEFKQPCVVFAGHPTLRFGDAVHFMEMWRNDIKNTVILTDSDYPMADVLAPYQPLAMKAFFYPIDTRLDFGQLQDKVLKDLKPKKVFFCEDYSRAPSAYPARLDLTIQWDGAISFRVGEVKYIHFSSPYKKMRLDPTLVNSLNLKTLNEKCAVCPLIGCLSAYDNKMELRAKDEDKGPVLPKPRLCGKMEAQQLISELKKSGYEARYESGSSPLNFKLILTNSSISIEVKNGLETSIEYEQPSDEKLREGIMETVLRCLYSI